MLALDGEEDEVPAGWLLVEEGWLIDGEVLVRQLASPLRGGGDVVRRFVVGVLLADDVVLNGAINSTMICHKYIILLADDVASL